MRERTLSIIKPDGIAKNLIGEVIRRIEARNLQVIAAKMIAMTKEQAKGFYAVHEGKPFFESVTDFMSSGPCMVMVLEGESAISEYRELMGATNKDEAKDGTIRRDYASDIEKNIVHGSDSTETAEFEINYFFNDLEIMNR
ncbi:nucleoside-diphosphate kinase [Thermodesulfobacteriota bacterium]